MNTTHNTLVHSDHKFVTMERGVDTPAAFIPERERSELTITASIVVFAVVVLWPLRDYVAFNADEGILLSYADRILRGQLPYRDFFTFVTPGSPYLTALWLKLFGNSLLVARSALLAYAGIFAAITYLLTRRLYSRGTALFATTLVLSCMPVRFLVLHNWDSTLFALLTVYCAQRALEQKVRFWFFGTGVAAALTSLTEQSKGAGVLLGLGIALLLMCSRSRGRRAFTTSQFLAAAAGFIIPLVVTFAFFAWQGAFTPMLEDLLWPMRHYSVVNRVPFGYITIRSDDLLDTYTSAPWGVRIFVILFSAPMYLVSALAVLVLANTIHSIALWYKGDASHAADLRVLGGCIFFGAFVACLATGRADMNRMIYHSPLFLFLVPTLLDIKNPRMRSLHGMRPVLACLLLVSFAGFALLGVLKARSASVKTITPRGAVRLAATDEAISYIRQDGARGRSLYVHPYQAFYQYLSGAKNPTQYDFLFPGMTTDEQYRSVIRDLEADKNAAVMLNTNFADKASYIWPSTPARALSGDAVTDYVLQHYRLCRALNIGPTMEWRFYYMIRRDTHCPTAELISR